MQIPQHQFDRLLQQDREAFVQRTMDAVREAHPAYRETDAMRRASVLAGFKRARRHGLSRDEDLMAWVLLMYRINPNFDEEPRLAAQLADPALPPAERFDRLFDADFDDAWTDAARWEFRDGRAWIDPDLPPAGPPDTSPVTARDWAELVLALEGHQGPATDADLAGAQSRLVRSLEARAGRSPADWSARADEVAARLAAR